MWTAQRSHAWVCVPASRADKFYHTCVSVFPLDHFFIGFAQFTWKSFGSWTIIADAEQPLPVLLVSALEIMSYIDICDSNVVLTLYSLDSDQNISLTSQSKFQTSSHPVLTLDFVLDFFPLFEKLLNCQKD